MLTTTTGELTICHQLSSLPSLSLSLSSQNKVFWNDVSEGTIYQADLDSGDNAVAIVSGFNRPSKSHYPS